MSADLEKPVVERLEALGIPYTLHRHPPVYTVEEAKRLRGDVGAVQVKNLFLRDKKEQMWLLSARETQPIDLKAVRYLIGSSGNPSFGSPERLMRYLGVEAGSVTPLAAINDREGAVRVLLDAGLRDAPLVGVHPNHNAATITLSPADLERYLASTGHPPAWLTLP
jgi:Ala-tRNA(Pro) deacylase